jgi:hypothetical protein
MRRTIVVHTRLAGHMARVDAARSGAHGIQIFTMGQMAARLAGGFLAPIDPESLRDAVREALPETDLGELENIKTLPGMVRATVSTFDKVWRADIDLSSSSHPRLRALAMLERKVLTSVPIPRLAIAAMMHWAGKEMQMQLRPQWLGTLRRGSLDGGARRRAVKPPSPSMPSGVGSFRRGDHDRR